jgi:hypothetical protein
MGSQSIAEGGKAKEEALQACAKQHREWPVGCSMQDWTGPLQPPLDLPCRHWPPPPEPPPPPPLPRGRRQKPCKPSVPCTFPSAAVALVTCFKTCSFGSSFTGCCTQEHKAFWECYTQERVRMAVRCCPTSCCCYCQCR